MISDPNLNYYEIIVCYIFKKKKVLSFFQSHSSLSTLFWKKKIWMCWIKSFSSCNNHISGEKKFIWHVKPLRKEEFISFHCIFDSRIWKKLNKKQRQWKDLLSFYQNPIITNIERLWGGPCVMGNDTVRWSYFSS